MNPSLSSHSHFAASPVSGWHLRTIAAVLLMGSLILSGMQAAYAVTVSNNPLYLGTSALPNVLVRSVT